MTIRRSLLFSFLGISLTVALVITLLTFIYMRQLLLRQVETQLQWQADRIMEQIDMTLFEHMANLGTWSQMRIMEELRVRDLDKRLSAFLQELQQGYGGGYQVLFAADASGEVLAASDAAWIGRKMAAASPWQRFVLGRKAVTLLPLTTEGDGMIFQTEVKDEAGGGRLGMLYAVMNQAEIRRFLKEFLSADGPSSSRVALLIDRERKIVSAAGLPLLSLREGDQVEEDWLRTAARGYGRTNLISVKGVEMIAGIGRSSGYRVFPGFGWQVVLMAPISEVMAPLRQLWLNLSLFFSLSLLASLALSYWLSNRIARPLAALTAFTRSYRQGQTPAPPKVTGTREVEELSQAYSQMMAHLEKSKQDLVRVSKLAVVGEMAAIMAHEVRTPLGIMRTAAEMLQREPDLTPTAQEMTQFILSETDRLKVLVTTLLECARPRPPRFCPCQARNVVGQVVELLRVRAERKGVRFEVALEGDDWVEGDPDHLVQVFLNLLMNALQHVPENGKILVRGKGEPEYWHAWICDDGPGVAPEWRERIFDPFFSRREGGIGLGLTVVQQIVLAHGGEIEITDSPLGGACFHLWLPREQEGEAEENG